MLEILRKLLNSIINYFKNFDFIYLLIGIILGLLIFFLLLYLISLIYKHLNKKEKIEVNIKYQEIVLSSKEKYIKESNTLDELGKINLFLDILYEMSFNIAKLYYPKSKNPVFEISINQLINALDYICDKIEFLINELLEGKFKLIDIITKKEIKDKNLAKLVSLLTKKRKENIISKVAGPIIKKYTNSFIDEQLEKLIFDLGEQINNLYLNKELKIKDDDTSN